MVLLIDDTFGSAMLATPFAEGWVETGADVELREHLPASAVGPADVALVSAGEATLLAESHVLVSDVAIVMDGTGAIVMRTPVRADEVDDVVIRLSNTGATAELLTRALIRPYFGITAKAMVASDDAPEAAEADVVILDDANGLLQPEAGFQDDLVRGWFVFTGQAVVSHVVVIGVEALARGAETELSALQQAVAAAAERKRDIRSAMAKRWSIEDRDRLAEVTNRQRFSLTADDRNSLANLVARGTWGSRFGKRLPAYRDVVERLAEEGDRTND